MADEKRAARGVLAAEPNDETAPWAVSHFHGIAKRRYVYTHNTGASVRQITVHSNTQTAIRFAA